MGPSKLPDDRMTEAVREFLSSGDGFTPHDSPVASLWLRPIQFARAAVPPPVPGIPIVKGFQCAACFKCFAAPSSRDKHRLRDHSGTATFLDAPIQALLPCIGRRFVRVSYGLQDLPSAPDMEAKLLLRCEEMLALGPTRLPAHKERNAWLRQSQWPELAASFIPRHVSYANIASFLLIPAGRGARSVTRPSLGSGHLAAGAASVAGLLTAYMKKLKWLCRTIDYRFLRLVMGVDDHGNVPNRGFRSHSVESTSKRYCGYLSILISGLLRTNFPHETGSSQTVVDPALLNLLGGLTPQQAARGSDLLSVLTDSPPFASNVGQPALGSESGRVGSEPLWSDGACNAGALLALHHFLLALWDVPGGVDNDLVCALERRKSFVVRFLLLTSLQSSFSENIGYLFQHVSNVTGRCSILLYWIRATVLMEIGRTLWQNTDRGAGDEESLGPDKDFADPPGIPLSQE